MAPINVAVVGMGKIASDQHLPAIAGNAAFRLAAVVSRSKAVVEGVACFDSLEHCSGMAPPSMPLLYARRRRCDTRWPIRHWQTAFMFFSKNHRAPHCPRLPR